MKNFEFGVGGHSGFGENALMTASVSIDRAKPSVEQKHLEGPLVEKIRSNFSNDQQILLARLIESTDLEVAQIENIPEEELEGAYAIFHTLVETAEGNGGKLDSADKAKLYRAIAEGVYA